MTWTVLVTGGERGHVYGAFGSFETNEQAVKYVEINFEQYDPDPHEGPWLDVVEIQESNTLLEWFEENV